jgi:threonine/homoserine/homoserine lactone efflux protein
MKQNPWSTALGAVGGLGLIVAAVCYFVGAGMGLDGLTVIAFSQWLGQFAGIALVGYLVYEAWEWRQVENARNRRANAAKSNASEER